MARLERRGVTTLTVVAGALAFMAMCSAGLWICGGETRCGRSPSTMTKLRSLKNALETYNHDHGTYPDQLSVLYTMKPPLIEKTGGQDSWKRSFIYRYPNMSGDPERPFDLVSTGKSGVIGAKDNINIWTMDEQDN